MDIAKGEPQLKIAVLGTGCATCRQLFELVEKVVLEMGLTLKVEYSTDVQRIISLGLLTSPVFTINEIPVLVGGTKDKWKIKNLIETSLNSLNHV